MAEHAVSIEYREAAVMKETERKTGDGEPVPMQIHHRFADGHTELVRRVDCRTLDDLERAVRECMEKGKAPPEGAGWLFCNSRSKFFVRTENVESSERSNNDAAVCS